MGKTALEMAFKVREVMDLEQRKKIEKHMKDHPRDLSPVLNIPLLLSTEGQMTLGITIAAEQKTKLLSIKKEFDPKFQQHYQEAEGSFAAVLTDKQKAQLKAPLAEQRPEKRPKE